MDRDGDHKAQPEGRQFQVIRNAQTFFSDGYHTQPEMLVIGKAVDPIPRTTQKRTKTIFMDEGKKGDMLVVPELAPKQSRREPVLGLQRTAAKWMNALKTGK